MAPPISVKPSQPETVQVADVGDHLEYCNNKLTYLSQKTGMDKLQIALMLSYPWTLLVGQLISIFSPEEMANNYFTTKRNIFNKLFVKQGWFWTTVLFVLMLVNVWREGEVRKAKGPYWLRRNMAKSIKRYLVTTLCWVFYSQWFFGLPIMDKIFLITGGSCYNIPAHMVADGAGAFGYKSMDFTVDGLPPQEGDLLWSREISSKQCRRLRGSWYGGHDPSGHVYLLTLSCSFLLNELFTFYDGEDILRRYNELLKGGRTMYKQGRYLELVRAVLIRHEYVGLALLVGLWYWMLLMTSIYFHSVTEKFAGLLFSMATIVIASYV